MAVRFQFVVDCRDPEPLARFWAAALRYEFEPPPEGFATWDDYWLDVGVAEEDLGLGQDRLVDPAGNGPPIWFQVVPDRTPIYVNNIADDCQRRQGRQGARWEGERARDAG